jgi:hypothetical protein
MNVTKIFVILSILLLLLLLFSYAGAKEYYGGKIKKIRRIPFNDCVRICGTYLTDCLSKYGANDAGWCYERFGMQGACVAECAYSSHHRM